MPEENRLLKKTAGARQGIQVIARAAAILRALENESDGLSLGKIAKRVNLPRSTVQRIVTALADEQMVIAATPNARVMLGPAILRMATNTHFDFGQFMRPHLEELALKTGETVDLSMLQGDKMVFVDQIISTQHRLRAVSAIGASFPVFSSANGKAALSLLDNEEIARLLEGKLFEETPHTIQSMDELLKEIDSVRTDYIAEDNEEHTEGICALGTAFRDPVGRVFAVSIPVPTTRFSRTKDSLREALLAFRGQLLAAL
jgi:DNA-binding IclR family transcriptional regulator